MMPTTFDHNDNLLDNEKAAIVCLFVLSLSIVAHLSQYYPECTLNLNLFVFLHKNIQNQVNGSFRC